MREFFVSNAGYWIDEFHLDGLRLDATQQIYDQSPEHVLTAIGQRARAAAQRPGHRHRRGKRAAGHAAVAADRPGRLRARRDVERRFSPQRDGRAHRPGRSLLQRHPRRAAGVHLRAEVRLSLSGAVLPLAARRPGHARPACAASVTRHVPPESRSGRELGARPARPRADESGTLAGDDGAAAARARTRRCCFRARNSTRRHRSCSSRTSSAIWRPPFAVAAANSCCSFPASRRWCRSGALDDPGADATFERCRLDFAERETHATSTRCTSTCCGCAAKRPRFERRGGTASTAACCRHRRSRCASSRPITGTTASWSSTSGLI